MTFDSILDKLTFNLMKPSQASIEVMSGDNKKRLNYYINYDKIKKTPLEENELVELNSIVGILQILYNSSEDSPISDSQYDTLQEMLIDGGYSRLTGSVEINDNNKESHSFTKLRGTLSKIYYLSDSEKRVNKSRKYLSEWVKATENKYKAATGQDIDIMDLKVLLMPKFDGTSGVLEVINGEAKWLTRGDTDTNRASNISFIMNHFNSQYLTSGEDYGIKFEIMCSENHLDDINLLEKRYNNSRQVVTAFTNPVDNDTKDELKWKQKYLTPIPLRWISQGDDIDKVHTELIGRYPTIICKLSDIDTIREFSVNNKYVRVDGNIFRTDGVVIRIIDENICKILGRNNNINNFEVAYKFTEEVGISKAVGFEFNVSDFGYIAPVLIVDKIKLKGNGIDHINLSNKLRFDELDICYGDEIEVRYDIIPYATISPSCRRSPTRKKIEFPKVCPRCSTPLDLNVIMVRCKNDDCPSRRVGKIMNFCEAVRIKNVGIKTLDTLYKNGFLDKGIRSLYKLRKKTFDLEDLDGFGPDKVKKLVSEIEAKRRLADYELFGAIGIDTASTKTFESIFSNIPFNEFMNMINNGDDTTLSLKLVSINGIGEITADKIIKYFNSNDNLKFINKLIEDLQIYETFGKSSNVKGVISFTGFRPNDVLRHSLESKGYKLSDSLTKSTTYLMTIPGYSSTKIDTARKNGIPIIMKDDFEIIK